MAYVDSLLAPGEEKLYVAHRHVIFLVARAGLRVVVAVALIVAGIVAKVRIHGTSGTAAIFVLLLIALGLLAQTLILLLEWRNEQYLITGRRVIQVKGIVGKQTFDSSLNMINDLITQQSAWGRMFNFGDLQIVTGNDVGEDTLRGVANPLAFKRALLSAKEAMMRGYNGYNGYSGGMGNMIPPPTATAPLPAVPAPGSMGALLLELADLRNRGVITPQEYDTRAAELVRGSHPEQRQAR